MENPILDKSYLHVWNLTKTYTRNGQSNVVLSDVNLKIRRGEFVSIIGHSGCGKSTLLSIIAGLTPVTSGAVFLEEHQVDEPGPDRGVVFQNHSLLPWLTLFKNVEIAVKAVYPDWTKDKRREHVTHYLEMVGLGSRLHAYPKEISGGMKQRVGIARAFAISPKVLLLDEPFGALDALTRGIMQDELIKLWESDKKTCVMITHDVDEAILLSDRIVLMSNGPAAHIAQEVDVTIPRPRDRDTIIDHPDYYKIRNTLVHYLTQHGHHLKRSA